MHPALPNVNRIFDRFYPIIGGCPVSSKILPRRSLIATNRKLPNLSSLLASNPFCCQPPNSQLKGFHKSNGCSCKVCSESFFTSMVYSPSFPDRGFTINKSLNCQSRNVIYQVVCHCGRNYIGRTINPNDRWANHKSHIRLEEKTCNLATHCIEKHRGSMVGKTKLRGVEEIKSFLKFTLVDCVGENGSQEELKKLEDRWRDRLTSWAPLGLNTRED